MRLPKVCLLALLSLLAGMSNAQEASNPIPLVDDRIVDQVIAKIGDSADLALILFEDVKLEVAGLCPATCRYSFSEENGNLKLISVEISTIGDRYQVGEPFSQTEIGVLASTPEIFNKELRRALWRYPERLLPRDDWDS